MGTDFTGERVVPGLVDVDLWNEHISRYTFAARLAGRTRVLDLYSALIFAVSAIADENLTRHALMLQMGHGEFAVGREGDRSV